MEDDECLNAGYGSNLTFEGTVECDSAIMSGNGHFGAVGALSGVRNPISVARRILERSTETSVIGRVHPMMLVSAGAHAFTEQEGQAVSSPDKMVCPRAKMEWEYWRAQLADATSGAQIMQEDGLADTVGAVAFCWEIGAKVQQIDVAAGVSSGGILLKPSGRVGGAAIFGAGCWASRRVAVSVSGTGEQIIRESLARNLGEAVEKCSGCVGSDALDTHEEIERVMNKFREACAARGDTDANAGAIVLVSEGDNEEHGEHFRPRAYCSFTTHSMAIGYTATSMSKSKTIILKQDDSHQTAVYISGFSLSDG
ncbi:hypothetical protein FRB94_012149 [Tulasnella sp. JGI-2019a]|nr:hypothetical protein FRB94_012149 [Tulasnella sp. JGI-2019a]